ncbi:hypothetical protein [Streptomyces sp. NPDC002676]
MRARNGEVLRGTDLNLIECPYDAAGPERHRADVLTAAASVNGHIIGWADDRTEAWGAHMELRAIQRRNRNVTEKTRAAGRPKGARGAARM